MSITGLESIPSKAAAVADPKQKSMGKNDFLKMLVAQLQSQDPLNPMDSTGFTAQLAQFSSLEQLQNIDASLSALKSAQKVSTNAKAVDFIGREITAVGDHFLLESGRDPVLAYRLDQEADSVYMKIYDADGNFVADLELGAEPAGNHTATWDGRDLQGRRMPAGKYSFQVMAVDREGSAVASHTFTSGKVSGVDFKDGKAYLLVDGRQIGLGEIVRVKEHQP